ncbi:MAG: hypothetical protein ACR2PL_07790 [Dehalococcoidia bacterium]
MSLRKWVRDSRLRAAAEADQSRQLAHELHCHSALAMCGAQQLPAGLGLLATHETLLATPALHPVARPAAAPGPIVGRTTPPLAPPPRMSV